MKPTLPAVPRAMRRTPTIAGVAPCAQAPQVLPTYVGTGRFATGYRTLVPRAASARTREAIRVDVVRRK